MTISNETEKWANQILTRCWQLKLSATEFLALISGPNSPISCDDQIMVELLGAIIRFATLCDEPDEQMLQYANILFNYQLISANLFITAIVTFDRFDRQGCIKVFTEKLCELLKQMKCTYNNVDECLSLAELAFVSLNWIFKAVLNTLLVFVDQRHSDDLLEDLNHDTDILDHLRSGLCTLKDDSFIRVLVYIHLQKKPEQILELKQIVENCKISFPGDEAEFLSGILDELITPPKFPIEDLSFIGVKEFRPAILTLGSIFASFRVLKADEEMADSFLMVGETFGMTRPEIIVDIFRSGFLIQLETVEREREALVDMFVYLKIPHILKKMHEQGVSKHDIYTALEKISNCTILLNEIDLKKADNTLKCILDKLKSYDVISDVEYESLVYNRALGIKQRPELDALINKPVAGPGGRYQLIVISSKAKQTFAKSLSQDTKTLFPSIALLMKSGEVSVDALCSVFCADGDLTAFSSKLASINSLTEKPFVSSSDSEEIKSRSMMFDCTFILLSRIKYVYMDMRLDDMVSDSTASAFYKWSEIYYKHIEDAVPIPVNMDLKRNFLTHDFISNLKQGQAFWNDSWNYGDLIEYVPVIGEILLDDYRRGQNNERDIRNILMSFQEMTCLLLCLIQWLETQRDDCYRQELAKTIEFVGKEQNSSEPQLKQRWVYMMLVAKKCLKQMVQGRRQKETRYTWVLTYARRQLPVLRQMEVPDSQMLKETYLYSNQQSWASPDVIAHIDRCNKSANHRTWCECWMMQMLKSNTVDELLAASELCLAAAFTSPVACLLEFAQRLVEYVLAQDSYLASINQNYATVLAKMLARIIILVIWAEDRRKQHQKLKTQKRMSRKRKHLEDAPLSVENPASVLSAVPTSDTAVLSEHSDLKADDNPNDDPVAQTIETIFLRFNKEVKTAFLRPPVTFIIFFIYEMAKAPRSPYWHRMVDKMHHDLIFLLSRLEPTCLSLPVFLSLYDISKPEETEYALKYACMLRKFSVI